LILNALTLHDTLTFVGSFPKIWCDAVIEIESSGVNGIDFQDGGTIGAPDGNLTIYPNYNLYLWAGDEIWVRTSGTGENVINVDTDDGDLRLKTQNSSIYLTANLGGDIHFEPSGNVYVNGGVSNVITTPLGAPADLTISTGLGNLILDAAAGYNVHLAKNLQFLTSPSWIYGTGQIILDGSASVHAFGKFYVSHATGNEISTEPITSIPDLTISTYSGDLILAPVGDVIFNPGGGVEIDDTLHFPNVTASFITAAGPLTITPTGNLTLNPTGGMTINAGGDFFVNNDISMNGVNPFIDGASLTLDAWNGNIRLIADSDVVLEPSSNVWVKAGVVVGTPSAKIAADGQIILDMGGSAIKSVKGISSTVNHGMTVQDDTDSFFHIQKWDSNGGLVITGLSAGIIGASFSGFATLVDTTNGTSSFAGTMIRAYKKSGTSVTSYLDTENVIAFRNAGTTNWIMKGNGDFRMVQGTLRVDNASAYVAGGIVVGNNSASAVTGGVFIYQPNQSSTRTFRLADASYTWGTSHGLTYIDSYLEAWAASPQQGGAVLRAASSSTHAMWIRGDVTTGSGRNLNGDARAPLHFTGYKSNGSLVWNEMLAAFSNNNVAKLIVMAEGTVISDGNGEFSWGLTVGENGTSPLKGQVFVNDNGANQDALILKSTASSQPFYVFGTSATWVTQRRWNTNGGGIFRGMSAGDVAVSIDGFADAPQTTTGTTSTAGIMLRCYDHNGSGSVQNHAAGRNIVVIRNGSTTDFIFKSGGTAYANISWTTWDEENDLSLVRAYSHLASNAIENKWDKFVSHNADDLHNLGLVVNGMTNMTGMMQLHNGALWQLHSRISELENMSITGMIKLILNRWLRRFI
jgi:hypothetical protein